MSTWNSISGKNSSLASQVFRTTGPRFPSASEQSPSKKRYGSVNKAPAKEGARVQISAELDESGKCDVPGDEGHSSPSRDWNASYNPQQDLGRPAKSTNQRMSSTKSSSSLNSGEFYTKDSSKKLTSDSNDTARDYCGSDNESDSLGLDPANIIAPVRTTYTTRRNKTSQQKVSRCNGDLLEFNSPSPPHHSRKHKVEPSNSPIKTRAPTVGRDARSGRKTLAISGPEDHDKFSIGLPEEDVFLEKLKNSKPCSPRRISKAGSVDYSGREGGGSKHNDLIYGPKKDSFAEKLKAKGPQVGNLINIPQATISYERPQVPTIPYPSASSNVDKEKKKKKKGVNISSLLTGNATAKVLDKRSKAKEKKSTVSHADEESNMTQNSKRMKKSDFKEVKDWQLLREGQKIGTKVKDLDIKKADNELLSQIKVNPIWNPHLASKGNDSLDDIDLDAEISLGFRNDFEELDEHINNKKQKRIVEKKYEGRKFPAALQHTELVDKVHKHWDIIPSILGAEGNAGHSTYYSRAKKHMTAGKTTMSHQEFARLPMNQFTIGFYGIKRQSFIASLIKKKFEKEIKKISLTNKTVQYWSVDSFVLYILASEIAARIAADDLGVSVEKAIEILTDTLDYGKYVTDEISIYN